MIRATTVLTIGHSDHSTYRFIDLLESHGVTAIADVRSMPYSRFNPQYNREDIKADLKEAGIGYVFLGKELGARRDEPECYVNGKARYDLIAKTKAFREGLARIKGGTANYRIALMCAERDPITCHRTILVARHLKTLGLTISHILEDGSLESTESIERRLLSSIKMNGGDLLDTEKRAIEQAYDIQGDRIAYTKTTADKP